MKYAKQIHFSFSRWFAIVIKEFIQLKRDRITFGMIVGIPLVQLILFGFAINTDPKHLPTAVVCDDNSEVTRSLISTMKNSEYFDIQPVQNYADAADALKKGELQFILTISNGFTEKLLRGDSPQIVLEADATDPSATGIALSNITGIIKSVAQKEFHGALGYLAIQPQPFEVVIHRKYNPEGITQYNIIPGLMGVILTMTLTLMTALAITREKERGTMENILATPTKPIEILSGKITPYILIGLIQASIILLAAKLLFHVPIVGSLWLIYAVALLFIIVNLTIGIMISSIAQNMFQSMQLVFFYFLPSILLSGFMFPFLGMPKWAQHVGSLLPLTYFNRLIRGVVLKGNGLTELYPNILPLLLIGTLTMFLASKLYRKTLD